MMYEFICVCVLLVAGLGALILITFGLASDLSSGNLSLEVKVETVSDARPHNEPIYTFCPAGEDETTLPVVEYCSFAFQLSVSDALYIP